MLAENFSFPYSFIHFLFPIVSKYSFSISGCTGSPLSKYLIIGNSIFPLQDLELASTDISSSIKLSKFLPEYSAFTSSNFKSPLISKTISNLQVSTSILQTGNLSKSSIIKSLCKFEAPTVYCKCIPSPKALSHLITFLFIVGVDQTKSEIFCVFPSPSTNCKHFGFKLICLPATLKIIAKSFFKNSTS